MDGSQTARRERAVAFVVARLSSSRLARKHFLPIGGKRLIQWITDALRQSRELDEIVIATADEPDNLPLRQFAAEQGLGCFWYEGNVDHVTHRLRSAAEKHGADICVLISGDWPLTDASMLDRLIVRLREYPDADMVVPSAPPAGLHSLLEMPIVNRKRAWQRGDDLSDRPELKEHQFPVFWSRPDLFPRVACELPDAFFGPPCRLSVDTWADVELMRTLHDLLAEQGQPFALPQVLRALREHPQLAQINAHTHQRKLAEESRKVLVVADAGEPYGYGHFMRSRELGLQVVERTGWPVTFALDDERAAAMVEERGLRVLWGALERQSRPSTTRSASAIPALCSGYDVVVLDLFGGRELPAGWRASLPSRPAVVVLDRSAPWTAEADLVVIPGETWSERECRGRAEVLFGREYVILRREIRNRRFQQTTKDLDVLAYLHEPEQRDAVQGFLDRSGLSGRVLGSFDPDFASWLARSRVFLSGFGIGCYEALFLGTYPAVWPFSLAHGQDARLFYERVGLPATLIAGPEDLPRLIPLCSSLPEIPPLGDGTPRIIDAMVQTLLRKRAES